MPLLLVVQSLIVQQHYRALLSGTYPGAFACSPQSCTAFTGESYQEDLMFTGLPEDSLNVLRLPDAFLVPATVNPPTGSRPASRLSQQDIALPNGSVVTAAAAAAAAASQAPAGNSSYTFGLMNVSSNKHFRFKWPEHSQLKFSPSVGHIHAGQSKSINVTFAANTPVKLDGQDIKLAISQITYKVCQPSPGIVHAAAVTAASGVAISWHTPWRALHDALLK